MIRIPLIIAAATLVSAAIPSAAQTVAAAPDAPDYSSPEAWLCRPDALDACATDQTVTVVEGDGSMRVEALVPDANRPFDCFYVYPTVSNDESGNSDMVAGPEERRVAHAQAARFRQHCRVFAPLYRQVTLPALRSLMAGSPMAMDRELAFGDVKAAWESYLANDNVGETGPRPVVLIGHSQGTFMVKELLEQTAAGPVRDRIVSALLIGGNVERPADGSRGGEIAWMPECERADQAGCFVSYVSFRGEVPPPDGSRFGIAAGEGLRVACVNPVALLGQGDVARAIFSTGGVGGSSLPQRPWVEGQPMPTTNFVSTPGLVSVACESSGNGAQYLSVTTNADPADPRTDSISGDVYAGDVRLDDWGLHLIDMPVVMGDLVELTARQHAAWAAADR